MPDAARTPWPTTIEEATALQNEWRGQVSLVADAEAPRFLAGLDVSYLPQLDAAYAVAALLDGERLTLLECAVACVPVTFPYIPGFLSFREAPALLEALAKLSRVPDMLMVDGQGIAHPRRFGIACHLGMLTGLPSIGVAKSRLCGRHADLPPHKGAMTPLIDKGERIGTVLRSKDGCLPLFISPGHRMDQDGAASLAFKCLRSYRLPEPTRIADKISKQKEHIPLAPKTAQQALL